MICEFKGKRQPFSLNFMGVCGVLAGEFTGEFIRQKNGYKTAYNGIKSVNAQIGTGIKKALKPVYRTDLRAFVWCR